MYIRQAGSRIRVGLACPIYLAVRNYLNNYFAMYIRLTRSLIGVDLASPDYWGLKFI